MARLFTTASSDIASYDNVILSGVPITLVCWAKPSVTGASQTLLTLRDKDNGSFARSCFLLAQGSADTVTALQGSTTGSNSSAVGTVSSGVWYHAAAVFASNSSRTAYLDGTAGTAGTTAVTTVGVDSAQIGASLISTSTVSTGFTGDIAEAAVYNVALTAAEIAMLAAGYSPLMVRPDALVAYWPVVGRNSPETDIVGNYDLTLTGTAASAHPRIYRPSAQILRFPSGAAANSYTLTGAVTHTLTPAATFSINRQHSIAGAVTLTLTPSATLAINRAYTLTGAVTLSLTPSASMTYTAAGTAAITGDVTYTLTPAATFAINRAYTLTGSVSHTLSVAAAMQYTAPVNAVLNGAVTFSMAVSGGMQYTSVTAQVENPSTGGGRPGRTYAYPSEPSRKRRKAPEKPQETTSVPEVVTKPYEVAGRLGAITEAPDNVIPLPVKPPVEVTGSPIEPVQKSLEELVNEAVKKAMAEYQAVQDGEKILKQLEKEEAELSLSEVESLLLLAMVE